MDIYEGPTTSICPLLLRKRKEKKRKEIPLYARSQLDNCFTVHTGGIVLSLNAPPLYLSLQDAEF